MVLELLKGRKALRHLRNCLIYTTDYRPIVDENVIKTFAKFPNYEELTTEIKAELLQLLTLDVKFSKLTRPLAVALSYTTASLAKCFAGERRKIIYPKLKF